MMCKSKIINKIGNRILFVECAGCEGKSSLKFRKCFKGVENFNPSLYDSIVLSAGKFYRVYKDVNDSEPLIQPSFVNYFFSFPKMKIVEEYYVNNSVVKIMKGNKPDYFYCIKPAELGLSFKDVKKLDLAFSSIINMDDLCDDYSIIKEQLRKRIKISDNLFDILLRYTVGFGVLEVLFADDFLQDVYIDSPGNSAIHVFHEKYEECQTNVFVQIDELEKLSSKLRIISKRPFDSSHPILNATIPHLNVRASGIREPLTFKGIAFAFRKHRVKPFTLPQLIKYETIDSRTAALLSFIVDSQKSILITGHRGSGKTSMMSALLLAIPQNARIIAIEDTAELPINKLREGGYKIQHIRTRSTFESKGYELTTTDALRAALRLGESVLLIGEVRGEEARALFEAMRIGAAGNVVIGTIHGSSPFDTFDRIVNDLKVEKTSFKATDIIISMASLRKKDSLRKRRKLIGITEVRKQWVNDPLSEGGFYNLAEFDTHKNKIIFNDLRKSQVIQEICKSKDMNFLEVEHNIAAREKIFDLLVKNRIFDLNSNIKINDLYYHSVEKQLFESKKVDYAKIICVIDDFLKKNDN